MFTLIFTVILNHHVLLVSDGRWFKWEDQCELAGHSLRDAVGDVSRGKAKFHFTCHHRGPGSYDA